MNKDILIQLLQDINNENLRFGTIEVKFTFHDGRTTCYELTTHRRRNVDALFKSPNVCQKESRDGGKQA